MSGNNPNVFYIRKDSPISRLVYLIESALEKYPQIQIRCAGTASQKGIIISQACVSQKFAKYSRFTTQTVIHNGKQIIFTLIKLKRSQNIKRNQAQNRAPKYVQAPSRKGPSDYKDNSQYENRRQQQNYRSRDNNSNNYERDNNNRRGAQQRNKQNERDYR